MEKRTLAGHLTAKHRRLTGHAASFRTPAKIGDKFTETIEPGAFKRSLETRADVLALVDHDASRLLGRTKNSTLRLQEDAQGLAFEIDVPDTQAGRDILALAERGDLGGMSFGFRVRPGGERWSGDRRSRTLTDVELVEISVVQSFPAYSGTDVQARQRDDARPKLERLRRRLRLILAEFGQ